MKSTASKCVNVLGQTPSALRTAAIAWIVASTQIACVASSDAVVTGDVIGSELAGSIETKIYGGERDNDAEEVGSVVAIRVGTGSVFELCTGALVAPNLVLTARHCISKNVATTVICDEHGKSGNGDHLGADVAISSISVYTGPSPKFAEAPKAYARELVHDASNILCDRDIAFIVLDRKLENITLAHVRVGRSLTPGEAIRSVGYGKNDMSLPTGTRIRRPNIPVLAVGQAVSKTKTPLGRHEFEVGLSTCQGDSGGPAISEATGAVVGVVSRGGACADDFGHIYTTTTGHTELFERAFDLAGASPVLEPGDEFVENPTTSDEPVSKSSAAAAGCNAASVGTGSNALGFLAGLALLAMGRRRRA